MEKKKFSLAGIPAILWNEGQDKLIIAVHGYMSNKEDTIIAILAEEAAKKGWSVLSFDLPDHGERPVNPQAWTIEGVLRDLNTVWDYAKGIASEFGLFCCSQGAYFSLLEYADKPISKALFLSPVTDMMHIMKKMMAEAQCDEEKLEREKIVFHPFAYMYWEYYCYVRNHPIQKWPIPTAILHGSRDATCPMETMTEFQNQFSVHMTIVDAEHFFHTPRELVSYMHWLRKQL